MECCGCVSSKGEGAAKASIAAPGRANRDPLWGPNGSAAGMSAWQGPGHLTIPADSRSPLDNCPVRRARWPFSGLQRCPAGWPLDLAAPTPGVIAPGSSLVLLDHPLRLALGMFGARLPSRFQSGATGRPLRRGRPTHEVCWGQRAGKRRGPAAAGEVTILPKPLDKRSPRATSKRMGRNVSKRPAGLETVNAPAEPPPNDEGCHGQGIERPGPWLSRRGLGDGTSAQIALATREAPFGGRNLPTGLP